MGLIDKAKDGIMKGIQYIEKGADIVVKAVSDVVTTIKDDVADARAERALNAQLTQQFNLSAFRFTMVDPTGEQTALSDVYAQVNYGAKTLTFFGELANLSPLVYFVDCNYVKFEVALIRVKQTLDIVMNNTVYPSEATVVEYRLVDDADTRMQMKSIVGNRQSAAEEETISKSKTED